MEAEITAWEVEAVLRDITKTYGFNRAHWLRGRTSDCRLREPGFESCVAMLKCLASFSFTLHCSSSLSSINECLAIDIGGYVYEQPSRIHYSVCLDASHKY